MAGIGMVIWIVVSTAEAMAFQTVLVTVWLVDGGTVNTTPALLVNCPPGAIGIDRLIVVSKEKDNVGADTGSCE